MKKEKIVSGLNCRKKKRCNKCIGKSEPKEVLYEKD